MNNRQLFLFKDHHMELIDGEVPEPGQGQLRIKIRYNGICGSDLHFYHEGRLGNFVVGKPYVPGHEASGIVDKIGDGVSNFNVGDQVVPEPGIPCGKCKFCKNGRYNLCPDVRFLSEPGTNGTFCDYVIMPEHFVHHIPKGLSLEKAALAEPVAVSVQAVNRGRVHTGDIGVIVGAGPIGLLTLQSFMAAGGAYAIVIDKVPERLEWAKKLGAYETLLAPDDGPAVRNIGDVVFETAGNNLSTSMLFSMAQRGGRVVQVGWPKSNVIPIDIAQMMEKEIDYMGVNRYANTFDTALAWLCDGRISADIIITQRFDLNHSVDAFNYAIEHPSETIKVMIKN